MFLSVHLLIAACWVLTFLEPGFPDVSSKINTNHQEVYRSKMIKNFSFLTSFPLQPLMFTAELHTATQICCRNVNMPNNSIPSKSVAEDLISLITAFAYQRQPLMLISSGQPTWLHCFHLVLSILFIHYQHDKTGRWGLVWQLYPSPHRRHYPQGLTAQNEIQNSTH